MRKLSLLPFFSIQLFAEGGGTGAGESGQTAAAAPAQPQTGAKGNPLADVQYGKTEEAPAAGEQAVPEDRNARFEALIKGEFKDLYEQRLKDTLGKRLKGTEEIVSKYNKATELFDLLGGKYGVEADDIDGLIKSAREDESYFEDEALESGLTVEQIKEKRRMKRENAELRAQLDDISQKEQADKIYNKWIADAETVKGVYPSFNLDTEMQNEMFRNLLRSNIPMQTAFEVIHKDEIIPAAMQVTAQKISQKVANDIRAGSRRPADGAMKAQSTVVTKSDVSQLTKADIDEINRRVARGERIVF